MDKEIFSNIGKILERGKKSSTYKYALLRGTIEIIQENSPYLYTKGEEVFIPLGLLVEKWLFYYYPIYELDIPQNTSENSSFEKQLKALIAFYKAKNGLSAFHSDYKFNRIPKEFRLEFFELLRTIRNTICDMPMKHIGYVFNRSHYSIYKPSKGTLFQRDFDKYADREHIINDFGIFSIPVEYYEVFKLLGNFIGGQDSILFKWAEFSVNASGKDLDISDVISQVLKNPITKPDILESKKIYRNIVDHSGAIYCVWSGDRIHNYDIDHVIPFSIWKNNDLWNLLPSKPTINNRKRDKIPSPTLIHKQRDLILNYWDTINNAKSLRFQKEIQIALLGNNPFDTWKEKGIPQLQESCNYLIENRGFEEWTI